MKEHKVLIAIPTLNTICVEFFNSIMGLKTNGMAQIGIEVGSLVYEARNKLVLKALERECDYILWLDSDMVFTPDVLLKLMEDAELGMDYVCGLYFKRTLPTNPVIAKTITWERDSETGVVNHGAELYLDYPKDQVFEIAGSGFGCVLTKTQLILDAAEQFAMSPFDPLPSLGEDYSFCWRVGKMGRKMYCDSRVKVGHVGTFIYGEDTYLMQKEGKTDEKGA